MPQTRDPLLAWLGTLPAGVEVVLDPGAPFAALPVGVREAMLTRTTVWTSNLDEARMFVRALTPGRADERTLANMGYAADTLAAHVGDGLVLVARDGPAGCAVRAAGRTTVVPGFPQVAVDTNGAGDTHTGALVAELAKGSDVVEACRRANAAAAIKVTRKGPATSPTAGEVDAFLAATGS